MKNLKRKPLLFLLFLTMSFFSFISQSKVDSSTEYTLKYKFDGQIILIPVMAANENDALNKGADICFKNLYKSLSQNGKYKVLEDQSLDIVDSCANPRI